MANLNINYRPRVIPPHCLYVTRSIIGKGRILVMKNQEITPTDILGKSYMSAGFSSINLAERLGVDPHQGEKYLKKGVGSQIFLGELLAVKKTLFGRNTITAPIDGQIEKYDPEIGRLLLKYLPKEISVVSGVYGIVSAVDQATGEVIIKTLAHEICGVYGSGKVRSGIIKILNTDRLSDSKQITSDLRGKIIVSGSLIYGASLTKTISLGINGVIVGGLNYADFQGMSHLVRQPQLLSESDIGVGIVATEGFGAIPIGADIVELLREYEGKFIFIHGNTARIILPCQEEEVILKVRKIQLPPSFRNYKLEDNRRIELLSIGQKVRIIASPFMGSQGVVVSIDKTPTRLESGIQTFCVVIESKAGRLKVPFTNIELL